MRWQRISLRHAWPAWISAVFGAIASGVVISVSVAMHLSFVVSTVLLVIALIPVLVVSIGLIWLQDWFRRRKSCE